MSKYSNNFLGVFEELVLLSILKLGKQAYGVSIAELLETASKKPVSTGALYTTLARLQEKGLINSWKGEATAERGGKAKTYFEISSLGKQSLHDSLEARKQLMADLTPDFILA